MFYLLMVGADLKINFLKKIQGRQKPTFFNLKIMTNQKKEVKKFEIAKAKVPTKYGDFWFYDFKFEDGQEVYVILNKDKKNLKNPVNLRLHSACFTSEIFGSLKCDCKSQLKEFLSLFENKESFMLIYFPYHEGRGIGFFEKIKAYNLQRKFNLDTYEANLFLGHKKDSRDFSKTFLILDYFKVKKVILYTNNPKKIAIFKNSKIQVETKRLIVFQLSRYSFDYLKTKSLKGGHLIKENDLNKIIKNLNLKID